MVKTRPTAWWYLAVLLGGVLMGALGYIAVKDQDPKMANWLLIISLIPTVAIVTGLVLFIALSGVF